MAFSKPLKNKRYRRNHRSCQAPFHGKTNGTLGLLVFASGEATSLGKEQKSNPMVVWVSLPLLPASVRAVPMPCSSTHVTRIDVSLDMDLLQTLGQQQFGLPSKPEQQEEIALQDVVVQFHDGWCTFQI